MLDCTLWSHVPDNQIQNAPRTHHIIRHAHNSSWSHVCFITKKRTEAGSLSVNSQNAHFLLKVKFMFWKNEYTLPTHSEKVMHTKQLTALCFVKHITRRVTVRWSTLETQNSSWSKKKCRLASENHSHNSFYTQQKVTVTHVLPRNSLKLNDWIFDCSLWSHVPDNQIQYAPRTHRIMRHAHNSSHGCFITKTHMIGKLHITKGKRTREQVLVTP